MSLFKHARFYTTVNHIRDLPPTHAEVAIVGRSNAGKSSALNTLCNHKRLAFVSKTPGRTQHINYFELGQERYLVDLPGYGYARRSKTMRGEWEHSLEEYLKERENLQCLFVLIDSRIDPQDSDLEFLNFLGNLEVPFSIVFTKIDKLNQSMRAKNMKAFTDEVLKNWEVLPPVFQTSAVEKKGRDKILKYIEEVNGQFVKPTF